MLMLHLSFCLDNLGLINLDDHIFNPVSNVAKVFFSSFTKVEIKHSENIFKLFWVVVFTLVTTFPVCI